MRSLSAGGAVVMRSLTIGQALAALAQEIDPELCRVLAADGEDLQRLFVPSMYDWSPHAGALRLDERKRRILAELVRRLQDGIWQLIWLPDVSVQGAKPFDAEQLPELVPGKSLDAEQSEVILSGTHHRVRVGPLFRHPRATSERQHPRISARPPPRPSRRSRAGTSCRPAITPA